MAMARKSNRKLEAGPSHGLVYDVRTFRRLVHATGNLASGLNRNRQVIAVEAIDTIVKAFMANPIYRNLLAADAFPRAHAKVRSGKGLRPVNEGFDVVWAAAILSHYTEELNDYLLLKERYSDFYLGSNFQSAAKVLDDVEKKFGLSLWATNAHLSIAQVTTGIAGQKAALNEIVKVPGIDPLYAYIAFSCSYSLEENVTLNDVRREFSDPSNIRDYFLYHVSPFDLEDIDHPHDVIALEASSPVIDRFETLVDMMSLLYLRGKCQAEIRQAVSLLESISDQRIANLQFMVSVDGIPPTQAADFLTACDQYTLGKHDLAANSLDSILKVNPSAAWAYELVARNDSALQRTRKVLTIADAIICETRAFLDVSSDLSAVRRKLIKIGFQTRKLVAARLIAGLLDRVLDAPISETASPSQGLSCLNSPLVQPSNYGFLRRINEKAFERLLGSLKGSPSPAHNVGLISVSDMPDAELKMSKLHIPAKRASLYLAYNAYNRNLYEEAAQYLANYRSIDPAKTNARTQTFQYALNRQQNRLDVALSDFVEAYFANPLSHSLYSMAEFASWAISQSAVDKCAADRAILLHIYSTYYWPRHDGDLSDALEDTLDYFCVRTPSGLIDASPDRVRLIYILRFVANIERLEDTTRFDSVDEIEAERILLLQWLVQNDATNRAVYTSEISSITKDQEVARLSAQFERSKIYVHEEGIKRTFDTEIRPLFVRYRQLILDPVVGAQVDQIEQRIRKLLKESDLQLTYLIIPSTERDSLFFAMIQRAYQILVLDPNHGFKTYLSTRILHGILEGELRASFVSEGLLVSVDGKNKEHEALERWRDKFSYLRDHELLEMARYVVKFSDGVIEAITELKDRRIRILSKELPEGLFAVELSDASLSRLKQSLTGTTTYEEFLDRLMQNFWESIDACLRDVKLELSGRFRKQIMTCFDTLESNLTSTAFSSRPAEVLDAIARCRTSFGFDLQRVIAWFARAGLLAREPFLASTAIRVAGRITNNCYPQHPLDIATNATETVEIDGELLNPLVDLLTNCFQNAAEHSGFDTRAPALKVNVNPDVDGGLAFEVISELSEVIELTNCRNEIEGLVEEDDGANPTAVAGEGRTGIRKIKRIIRHDFQSNKKLVVNVTDDRSVCVVFSVPGEYVRERSYH
ncbi:hypothetical protein [Bradyrhizobium genosp. P]|uniref:hypothetical protein n=1 Tax=Bradyrhizobium genosp. P TaxID=83641 RepID=UPI003CFAF353